MTGRTRSRNSIVLDPCTARQRTLPDLCPSILTRMRVEEEGLGITDAIAVVRQIISSVWNSTPAAHRSRLSILRWLHGGWLANTFRCRS